MARERIKFNGSLVATDPFKATASPSSDRAWSTKTFDVTSKMPGTDLNNGYGEQVAITVDHTKTSPYDCLAWAAMIFSTTVKDTDGDGLIDKLEDISGLKDPGGAPLPDLRAMGASSRRRDLFAEVGALWAAPGTAYGSGAAMEVDGAGHNHLPTPEVLKMVGDAFKDAPVSNQDGSSGIKVHFDVGPAYHDVGPEYASTEADEYIIPAGLARGGEFIKEEACVEDLTATPPKTCQFPAYPGTVSWKIGFQIYRDAPVGPGGQQLTPAAEDACDETGDCRRRFDRVRKDIFHYLLYAHARGKPKELCLSGSAEDQAECRAFNPDFHVTSSSSGVGDQPGGDGMVTLGLWENFVGTKFVQATTTMHELGHAMWRTHGGDPLAGSEINCKPNYLSVMNYLFQLGGMVGDDGVPRLNYSGAANTDIDESLPSDGSLGTLPYRTAWFAPLVEGTLGFALGTPAAKRYCGGASFPDPLPEGWVPMARIESASVSAPVDWDADGDSRKLRGAGRQLRRPYQRRPGVACDIAPSRVE